MAPDGGTSVRALYLLKDDGDLFVRISRTSGTSWRGGTLSTSHTQVGSDNKLPAVGSYFDVGE